MNKTITKLKNKLVAAAALALMAAMPALAQTNFIIGPTINATSNNNRAPNGTVDFHRASTIFLGSEFPGLATGPITKVGFSIQTPGTPAAVGNIKIYMANTTDATYNRGTTWATILTTPTAMSLVYDGPLTIPTTVGPFNVTLQTPFAYTGGNFYFAFEWSATTKATTGAIYDANNSLPNSLVTQFGTTLASTDNLTLSSGFRPVLQLGVPAPPNDMDVRAIFVQGKMALNGGGPQVIKARVKNNGSNTLTNRVITLTVGTGATAFTNTFTLGTLAPGVDTLITFAPYTPTAIGNSNLATVSVAADDVLSNNTKSANIVVTANTQGYAEYPVTAGTKPTVQTAIPGQYPTTARTATNVNGNFLVRFTAAAPTRVTIVRAYVPGAGFNALVNTVGATVYGVVFNSAGVEIARSGDIVLTAGDVDNLVTFPLTNPPVFNTGDVYYVGMAIPPQPSATAAIYPMAVQTEQNNQIRANTFFVSPVTTTASVPVDFRDDFRFVIEADIVDITGLKEDLNSALVSVFPNPSNGVLNISAKDLKGGNTLALEVRDMQGRVVYTGSAAKNGATLNLNKLAAGVYLLKVSTDAEVAMKRLVIQ